MSTNLRIIESKPKLRNAPNMKEQDTTGFSEIVICIGSQAWDFAKQIKEQAQSADEMALAGISEPVKNVAPVVVHSEILENISQYSIAPKKAKFIRLWRANGAKPFTGTQLAEICTNLAKHTQAQIVQMVDESGALLENLSNYVSNLRNGKSTAIERTAEQAPKIEHTSPYIEKRTIDGKTGLFRIIPKYDNNTGELLSEKISWLSDVVEVVGVGRNGNESYLVVQFQPETQSAPIVESVPLGDVGERDGWKYLKNRGLRVASNAQLKNELADYLQTTGDRKQWTISSATGWQNGAYILPNGEVLGEPEMPVIFRGKSAVANGYDVKGTAESWREHIGNYANQNPSMMLAAACALSAPLIGLIGAESFGVHLFGGSTAGKTTTGNIASSIYGHPENIRLTWFGTALSFTNEAAARNDNFMPLDEIGQGSNRKHVEQTAYTLFNGIGKNQGDKDGGNRELNRWRILAFSTGETDLESYLAMGGVKINAGQLVRLLNIPITQAKHWHGLKDGKAHADYLNQQTQKHYGAIGRDWIVLLQQQQKANPQGIFDLYQKIKTQWLESLPTDTSPQVQRVAGRFAVLETALHLAKPLTGWTSEDCNLALRHSFNEWVNIYGFHSREEKQIIEQVNGWLLRYGSRFIEVPINPNQKEPNDVAGYRMLISERNDKERFFVYPQVYLQDVITGFNERQANEILFKAGMLERSNETKPRYKVKLPHHIDSKRTRCYMLIPINERDDDNDDLTQQD